MAKDDLMGQLGGLLTIIGGAAILILAMVLLRRFPKFKDKITAILLSQKKKQMWSGVLRSAILSYSQVLVGVSLESKKLIDGYKE